MSISIVDGKFYADRLDLNDWSPEEERITVTLHQMH